MYTQWVPWLVESGQRGDDYIPTLHSSPLPHLTNKTYFNHKQVTRGKKDWHECIDFLGEYDRVRIINGAATNIFNSKNQWPEVEGVDFKGVVDEYISKISKVGQAIIEAIAASYNLPLHGFDGFAEDPFYILRLLYYPVMPPSASSDGAVGIGVGEHTDYGCLTLIHTLQEGLEIKPTPDSDWMSVPVMGDCLVCNIGDMLSYWTRHILKATPHRVRRVQKERLSIAFFFEPNPDTVIRPLESLRGHPLADPSAGDSPVLYGQYLQGKYESSYPTFTPDGAPPGN
jgi:isopenicillin N synthase-like dioxygenase